MKIQKIIIGLFFLLLFLPEVAICSKTLFMNREALTEMSRRKKKKSTKEDKASTQRVSDYDKLFTGKTVKTVKGLMTLHKVEDKVYMEIPLNLLNESLLLSSGVERVSNMTHGYVGQMPSKPVLLTFSKTDSLVNLRVIEQQARVGEQDTEIRIAVEKSTIHPIIRSFPILAYHNERNTVVFDVTPFFLSDSRYLGSFSYSTFGGFVANIATFNKESSSLQDIAASDDHVVITNNMTYGVKTYFLGMETAGINYMTMEVSYVLSSLPTEKMPVRYADPRIGVTVSPVESYSSREQGSKMLYMSNRWRVEPKDEKEYRAGQLVEPKKQIVFYIDTLFYPSWRIALKEGVEKWNKAFEKIGFKNVLKAVDYPTKHENPLFNASNAKYNCIKYSQMVSRGVGRRIVVDPATGEIISASLFVGRDFPITLQRERIYKTAALEPEVRAAQLPENLLCEALSSAMMQNIGYCLGLSGNFAGTSWIPVDSLRSPSFTRKEGITSTVMDNVRYNYVAQPGDIERGVSLMVNDLGVYDYYAIRWLYQPIYGVEKVEDERAILTGWIQEKKDDPRYKYGKEQNWRVQFDPRSLANDLGDDPIKAAKYGIENLKYVAQNGVAWVNKDDTDGSYKELFVDFILLQLYDYMQTLAVNVGGMEINEKFVGDPTPSYVPIPKEIQQKSYQALMEIVSDLTWMDNRDMLYMSGLNPTISEATELTLMNLLFFSMNNVVFTQNKSDHPYSIDEMLNDLSDFCLKDIERGVTPTRGTKAILQNLVKTLIQTCDFPEVRNSEGGFASRFVSNNLLGMQDLANVILRVRPEDEFANGVLSMATENIGGDMNGFMPLQIKYMTPASISDVFYKHLHHLRGALKSAIPLHKDPYFKNQLEYLVVSIDKVLH